MKVFLTQTLNALSQRSQRPLSTAGSTSLSMSSTLSLIVECKIMLIHGKDDQIFISTFGRHLPGKTKIVKCETASLLPEIIALVFDG